MASEYIGHFLFLNDPELDNLCIHGTIGKRKLNVRHIDTAGNREVVFVVQIPTQEL